MHSGTRYRFIAVHQIFAFAKGIQKHRHCAHSATVQQTNMRVSAINHLAIHFQHQPEYAMSRWMLWTEI